MAEEKKTYSAVPSFMMIPIRMPDPTNDENEIVKLFKVYVKGPGCPLPITIEVDGIWETYQDEYPAQLSSEDLDNRIITSKYINAARRVTLITRRDLLVTVTEGLSVEAANVLVAPDDEGDSAGLDILIKTKWMDKSEPEQETDDETKSEAKEPPKDETGA